MVKGAWSFLKTTAWCIPISVAFSDCIASIVKIQGQSMQPTLNGGVQGQSDWVLVEKLSCKWLHKYERGSVVVLWAPDDPHQQLVKRLVALEGDSVWEAGKTDPVKIPQGRCWIEGDNPVHSGDSRNMYGPVHLGLLEGRVMYVIWPPEHFRRVATYLPNGKIVQVDVE